MTEYTTHPSASQPGDVSLSRALSGGAVSVEQALRLHGELIHLSFSGKVVAC